MFLTLWAAQSLSYFGGRNMSNNYRFYAEKMDELRVRREINRPLLGQLHDLFLFVKECEAQWGPPDAKESGESGDA